MFKTFLTIKIFFQIISKVKTEKVRSKGRNYKIFFHSKFHFGCLAKLLIPFYLIPKFFSSDYSKTYFFQSSKSFKLFELFFVNHSLIFFLFEVMCLVWGCVMLLVLVFFKPFTSAVFRRFRWP